MEDQQAEAFVEAQPEVLAGFERYGEGQEDQLDALALVVNAIILWNTRYMERALRQPK